MATPSSRGLLVVGQFRPRETGCRWAKRGDLPLALQSIRSSLVCCVAVERPAMRLLLVDGLRRGPASSHLSAKEPRVSKPPAERRRTDRVLIARIAAAERWGRTADRAAATEPARQGLRARFERDADPCGLLSPQERARGAELLMRAHMLRMSRAAAEARHRAR